MLPRVIVHNMVSVDGRMDWFEANEAQFYETVKNWSEDCTLAGADTILDGDPQAAMEEPPTPVAAAQAEDDRPLLVVVDSRARVKGWSFLRSQPHWRGVMTLCSETTPRTHLDLLHVRGVPHIVTGGSRVDLRESLARLHKDHGVRVVRVESGGTLSGVLLRAGLVSVVSILIHPALVGGSSPSSFFRAPDLMNTGGVIPLRLVGVERLGSDVVWLRYLVAK
ncbi:MAG: RibD family protein [Coriobacteriia bacterium]|nr:RibD family protein [Coriobacteriia bacterium]